MEKNKSHQLIIDGEFVGLRLDKAVSLLPEVHSRTRAEELIDLKLVTVNSIVKKSSYRLQEKDVLSVLIPAEATRVTELVPFNFKLDILFEDNDLIVINKPAGLVVHPAAGHEHDTLVNALIHHTKNLSMKFGEVRPGIVHRLDRDTSGIIVVAKNDLAHERLSVQFKERTTHRKYFALVLGKFPKSSGSIQSYLLRHPSDRKRYASLRGAEGKIIREYDPNCTAGKWAVTHYEKVPVTGTSNVSYLSLKLETGRTHQIRVHLSELGFPIVSDPIYGANQSRFQKTIGSGSIWSIVSQVPRLALHAAELGFTHPTTGEKMSYRSDWPSDLLPILKRLGVL